MFNNKNKYDRMDNAVNVADQPDDLAICGIATAAPYTELFSKPQAPCDSTLVRYFKALPQAM